MEKPELKLSGTDGNVFAILARAKEVAESNNMNWTQIQHKALAGDYNNVIIVLMEYFDVK